MHKLFSWYITVFCIVLINSIYSLVYAEEYPLHSNFTLAIPCEKGIDCEWDAQYDSTIIRQVQEDSSSNNAAPKTQKTFTFRAVAVGKTTLTLSCKRKVDNTILESKSFGIEVTGDHNPKTINIVIGGRLVELNLPITEKLPPNKKFYITYGDELIEVTLGNDRIVQ